MPLFKGCQKLLKYTIQCRQLMVPSFSSTECVVPENVHAPPPLPHSREGKRGQRPRNVLGGGGGGSCLDDFFSTSVSSFIQLYWKFRCLHFSSWVANGKKINLANLKHKMNINFFVLVRLDILSLIIFPSSGWWLNCMVGKADVLIVPDWTYVCRTWPGTSVTPICIASSRRFRCIFKLSLQVWKIVFELKECINIELIAKIWSW